MKEDALAERPAHKVRRRLLIGGALGLVVAVAVAVALVAGPVSGWAGFGARPETKPVVALEFIAGEVVRLAYASLPVVIEFSGPLVAPRTAIVRAKAAGTLLELRVAEGSRVKAGQALGEIDLADLQSRVLDRTALVDSAQASLAEAQRQHLANVGLASQNFISPTALQTSQARLDAARAQVKSAEAQLSTSRLGVKEAALVAPISGIVGKRHVVPGEKVSAEQQLLTVVDLSTLEVAGTVGTHEVSLLQPGQPVEVRVEGQGDAVPGRIDRIAPAAEAGTRAIGVVVVLDNRDERFRAGQYAQARVRLADSEQRLTLPASAIGQASGQDYVWTLEKDALVRRIVVTGRTDPASGRTEVIQGLVLDAQVLAARFDNLKEGAPARFVAQRAAPTASTPASAAPKS
ncbi:MAG TPA: efflux RND transporter periplasmic adaptor subunit [Caldimonas sp.]